MQTCKTKNENIQYKEGNNNITNFFKPLGDSTKRKLTPKEKSEKLYEIKLNCMKNSSLFVIYFFIVIFI